MPIDRSDVYWDFLIKGMAWDLSRPSFIQNCKKRFTEKANADPNFQARMREVALEAIQFEDVSIVRNGLTALTFVGKREDIPLVERLTQHSNKTIVQDALTCLFDLHRVKTSYRPTIPPATSCPIHHACWYRRLGIVRSP